MRPIGRTKQTQAAGANQQASVVINYDKRDKGESMAANVSDVKMVSLQDLMTWNVMIKVPTYQPHNKQQYETGNEQSAL